VMTAKALFSRSVASIFGASFMRTIFLIPVMAAGFVALAPTTARAEAPATYMQRVQNELIAAQRAGSVSAFSNVLRRHMDVPSIGITALGPHAKTLAKGDRPALYSGMINFISKYAAKEAPKYPVASAVVTGQGSETAGGATVDTHITLKSGEGYDVRWKLVRSGQSYKVRDAQVIGFWMTSFLDTLFQNYIAENGNNPHALVVALNR
jgi:phospholipid transport system substrate-binding protein